MVFILSALWLIRIRGLWKLPDGRDWLRGKLGLVLMGRAMLSKSLTQFSIAGLGCVPSRLFDLRPNYGGSNEDNDIQFSQFSGSVLSDSLWPHGLQHTRLPCPSSTPRACSSSCPSCEWCHPTISSSVVPWSWLAQSCPTLCNPRTIQSMKFSRPEYWSGLPFPSSGDRPNSGSEPRSPTLQADSLPADPPGKPKNIREGSLSLLEGTFPIWELNRFFLHCRWILYQLSYQGSPW